MKLRTLVAALVLAPAVALAAPAQDSSQPAGGAPGLSLGGFLGYETDTLSGLSLRVDGELPYRPLGPQLKLSWVGSIGYSHLTKDEDFFGVSLKTTANVLKFVPAARFTLPLSPAFSVFGDAGLGLYYVRETAETTVDIFTGEKVSSTASRVSVLMRFGVGGWYVVNPKLRLGAMLELDPYFGDFDQTTFLLQIGAMFGL
jgi:hypothetical protein